MRGLLIRKTKQSQKCLGFAAAVRRLSSSSSAHGGWKIPTASNNSTNLQSNSKRKFPVEYVSITHPQTQASISIALQQRFTVAPGQQASRGDQTGTWAWPTTHVLLDHFLQHNLLSHLQQQPEQAATKEQQADAKKQISQHKLHILELGAGCGLLGMALAAIDPNIRVTLTDHSGNMEWLRRNLDHNRALLPPDRVVARTLSWGDTRDIQDTVLQKEDATVDVILGSDLIYEASRHSALVDTLVQLTQRPPQPIPQEYKRPPIVIYLAYPHRDQSTEDHFFKLLQQHDQFGSIEKQTLDQKNKRVHVAAITCD